jgi:magnesium chelatase family protein
VGGGNPLAAGEITLAHHGVLFLDELPEFRREVLEGLRQPLESGEICLSRAGRQARLPAHFQLITAMNPCPCGYHGHPRIPCHCAPQAVRRYRQRISGPLMDRIDLRLEIPPTPLEALAPDRHSRSSLTEPNAKELLGMIECAQRLREERDQTQTNAHLQGNALDQFSPLQGEGRSLLAHAVERRGLSARAVQSLRRVARTLADLEGQEQVLPEHLAGALALRAPIE